MKMRILTVAVVAVMAAGLGGCPPPDDPGQAVSLTFAATVAGAPLACGQSYTGIGSSGSSMQIGDLRVYISHVRLHGADGDVDATVDDEAPWQAKGVALLDFEDGTGKCSPGTADTRTVVNVHAPEGTYDGVTFDVGVPDDVDHADASKAPSPLNLSSLYWGWAAGYRFFKLDIYSDGQPEGWYCHVGSAGCDVGAGGVVQGCDHPNRPTISLSDWSPDKAVTIDVGALLSGADIDNNTADTAPGCMSEPTDPDCESLFHSVGLPFAAGEEAPAQSVFGVGAAP